MTSRSRPYFLLACQWDLTVTASIGEVSKTHFLIIIIVGLFVLFCFFNECTASGQRTRKHQNMRNLPTGWTFWASVCIS